MQTADPACALRARIGFFYAWQYAVREYIVEADKNEPVEIFHRSLKAREKTYMTKTKAIDFSGIEKAIVSVKGQNVIIDSDVARVYGTETREINKAVKNNPDKFPSGYIIDADKNELVENFHRFKNLKHSTSQPKAFTEKGLYMRLSVRTGSHHIEKPEGNGGGDSNYRGFCETA
jgi:hypothetical protein